MKTKETILMENILWKDFLGRNVFGCNEVTIGSLGNERVDFLTFDTNNVWRCYEIKVSESDFYSDSKKTFVGNYNYFVLTKAIYKKVKKDIPDHVGVYLLTSNDMDATTQLVCEKRAKKQKLLVEPEILSISLIRSLCREAKKHHAN